MVLSSKLPQREELEKRIGNLLAGRFKLERVLGIGGMSWVYLATQQPLGRKVAVKILASKAEDDTFRHRFFREASVAANLTSPFIVTIHDYGETPEGDLFIVMEHVEGESLNGILKREGPMEPGRVCLLTRQICRGLSVAHDVGVVHRDLKPANIMVRRNREGEEVIKILDFGLVKTISDEPGSEDSELTAAGTVLGSPNYMSPEQIRRKGNIDQRTDVYAMGAMIYRLLTGQPPFKSDTLVETMSKHLNDAPPPLDRYIPAPDFSTQQLENIIHRCMQKNPDDRYQNMDQLSEALEGVEWLTLPEPTPVVRRPSSLRPIVPRGPQSALTPPPLDDSSSISLSQTFAEGVRASSTPSAADLASPIGSSLFAPPLEASPSQEASIQDPLSQSAPVPQPVDSSKKVKLWIGGAALVAAGAVAAFMALQSGQQLPKTEEAQKAPAGKTQVAEPVKTPVAPDTAQEAEKPALTKLALTSVPSGAKVRQGDKVLGTTPLSLDLPQSEDEIELTFSHQGYRKTSRKLVLQQESMAVEVQLKKRGRKKVTKKAVAAKPEVKKEAPAKLPRKLRLPPKTKLRSNPYD